ncbi:MAG: ABC transporter permease [Clostridia bacterium]|nr:ABC transporter permease [Clostridia bacterium]
MPAEDTTAAPLISWEKRLQPSPVIAVLVPVLSVFLALGLGAVFLAFTGFNPLEVYQNMLHGAVGSRYGFSETIVKAIPLMLAGLGVSVAFRMLLWNIGAEGQFYMGTFGASWVALSFPELPFYIMLPAMFIAGCLMGGLWACLPAIPRALWGVNEVITTLMLNYVAILWVDYLVYGPWKDPQGFNFPLTVSFSKAATLPTLLGTRVHLGLVFALMAALLLSIVLWRTRWGYEIRVTGENASAASYAGMNIKRNIILVMFLSGALAGLAGMSEVAGITHRLQHGISPGYGYTAIIVAWLAKLHPAGIILVSFLFGGLIVGGYSVQTSGVPAATVSMLQSAILFFVLGGEILTRYRLRIGRKGGK